MAKWKESRFSKALKGSWGLILKPPSTSEKGKANINLIWERGQMAYNGAGIYGVYDVVKNKIYIGKSEHIERRFQNHKYNFKTGNKKFPMYQEPIEHFAFLVLCKLTEKEYERFGDMLEELYIFQARRMNIPVYNRNLISDRIYSVLWVFKVEEHIAKAIKEKYGRRSCDICKMGERSRKELCEELNTREKED